MRSTTSIGALPLFAETTSGLIPPLTVADALRGASRRALAEAITRAGEVTSELLIDTDLLTGRPALAVTESGAGALMLVVGARGAGGFAAMLLCSITSAVPSRSFQRWADARRP